MDIDVTDLADRIVELEGGAAVLDVQVRRHSGGGGTEDLRVVELALANRQQDSREARDAHWLFQTETDVTAFPDDQAAVFLPVDDPLDPANRGNGAEGAEERGLRLLHRNSLSHAKGRNVAVHAQARDGERNAHRFANRAMALQRRNTAIASARAGREDDRASYREAYDEVHAKGRAAASRRPFQLAFVLLNLDSLSRPGHPHRGTGREALVDLLFFPTGGGKTEAYLGLAAYTFALRRLQSTIGSGTEAHSGEAGVGVLMRYTLSLLTAQQFQRESNRSARSPRLVGPSVRTNAPLTS